MVRALIRLVEVLKKIETELRTVTTQGLEVVGILPIKRWIERTPFASGVVAFCQGWSMVLFVSAICHALHYSDFAGKIWQSHNWLSLIFAMQRYYQVRLEQQAIRLKHDEEEDAAYLNSLTGLSSNFSG